MSGLLLAGPPGVGKTTVARHVAQRLGIQAVDLDELIEARSRRSPAEILEQDGEPRFRALELEALEALGAAGIVVALGGGALTQPRTRQAARRLGPIVRLDADREVLESRLKAAPASRPLIGEDLGALLDARKLSYASVDVIVDGRGPPEDVAPRVQAASEGLSVVLSRLFEDETRILVGRKIAAAVVGAVAHLEPTRPVLLVRDRGLPEPVRRSMADALSALFPCHVVDVEGGESAKTWSVLGEVLTGALEAGCGRQSVVVGLGGGAICDLANLVAHLLGRGAQSVLVPSTLLAQVDASVGGKCAVNHGDQRNSVGAFHAPAEVIIDLDLLTSLDPADYRAGLAELVKMAIIGDSELFQRLEAGEETSPELVARAVGLKAKIVARDPLEHGERRTLNLGHTLGHALEAASGFKLRHGEAVSLGLVAAARASVQAGHTDADTAARIERLLARLELPTRPEPKLLESARTKLSADKKGDAFGIDWVAIRRIGEVTTERLSWDEVERTLLGPKE